MGLGWEEAHTTVRVKTDANFQQKQLFLSAQETTGKEYSAGGLFCYKKAKKHTTEKWTSLIRIQPILHAF